jgi:redox-sensing transcriptional repressor
VPNQAPVPQPTISRLPVYLRILKAATREGVETLSSADMEARTGISSDQIRKDLSYFGEFGKPGTGYCVAELLARLVKIIGLDREQQALIVGAGNLGTALIGYPGFAEWNFHITAVYDNDPNKIGRRARGLEVWDVGEMAERNRQMKIGIGIIATPAEAAPEVADTMIEAGVRSILNFAPVRLTLPDDIAVRNVDMTLEFHVLSYRRLEKDRTLAEARRGKKG